MENYSDHLIKYIRDELSEKEVVEIEDKIKHNPALREEVEFLRRVKKGALILAQEELNSQMELWDKELKVKRTGDPVSGSENGSAFNPFQWKQALAIAASLLLFAGFLTLMISRQKQVKNFAMVLSYATPPSGVELKKWSHSNSKGNDIEGIKAFGLGNFDGARLSFDYQIKNTPYPDRLDTLHFLAGHCALQLKQPSLAASHFQFVMDTKNSELIERSKYHLALATLMDNNPSEAHKHLSQISSTPDHPFQREAQDLLKVLEAQ